MTWINNKHETLSSSADTVEASSMTASDFNMFLFSSFADGQNGANGTYNNNSNSVYATRYSFDGDADGTQTSQTQFWNYWGGTDSADRFNVGYFSSISGEERYGMVWGADTRGSTASPHMIETIHKFVPGQYAFSFTTTDATSLIYGGRRYGVEIKSGHSAIGTVISDIEFYISKSGSPTGSAYFKVYNSSGVQQATTAALDVSTLGSIAFKKLALTSNHTIVAGDRIVCEFSGGDSSNYVGVGENNNSSDQPTNAELVHYNLSGGNAWGENTSAIILCKFGDAESITSLKFTNTNSGSYASGTNLSCIGDGGIKELIFDPADIQDNTIFEETDTKQYLWCQTLDDVRDWYPTLQDSFTTDKGTEVGGEVTYNSTDNAIDINFDSGAGQDRWYLDLGSVSDTKWTVQFSLNKTSHSSYRPFHIHLSDKTVGDWQTSGGTSQDSLGIYVDLGESDGQFQLAFSDDSTRSTTGNKEIKSGTYADNNTKRYFTLKRLSATSIYLAIHSDSARKDLIGEVTNTNPSASTTGLRYFVISKEDQTRSGGAVNMELDDFQFFDGVSI